MRRILPLRAPRFAWPLGLALSALVLSACQPQAPASAAAPEATTAAPPPAMPSPDPNAAPVVRAAPPLI